MSRAQLAQLGLGVVASVGERFRQFAGLAGQGVGILFLKFGRDDENQSDTLGLRYMTRAGYDPYEMPKVFATLDRVSESHGLRATPQWLSTHPNPGNRIGNIEARIAKLPPEQRRGTVGREAYLRRLRGLVFGDDPRQGYAIGRTYYHPELTFKIDFPDEWRIINQRQAAGALSPNGDAAVVLTLADEESPQAALDAFFGQQGVARGPSRGRNIYSFRVFDTDTGEDLAEGLVGYISHGGRLYQLIGYTGVETWQSYGNSMLESLTSFAEVTERRYLEVTPATIEIVELPQEMDLNEFVGRYPSTVDVEQVAIINGLEIDTEMGPGTLVKRVVGGELPKN
jgi:predicted Zn-dependent protease